MARMPNVRRNRPDGHRGEVQLSLLPEAGAVDIEAASWESELVDRWGHARVVVRLISCWTGEKGWQVGWYVRLDAAGDEWHPSNPKAHLRMANYPWYRLDDLPTSTRFGIAAGEAARAAKIVLAQMLEYADDAAAAEAARVLSDRIEVQARAWLSEA